MADEPRARPAPVAIPVVKYKRSIKLIRPGLQLRLTGVFVGMSVLGLVLQACVFMRELASIAAMLPSDGPLVLGELQGTVLRVLGITLALLLPIMLWVGVLVTHRIAGPVYRFETYLLSVIRGERPGNCTLRKGDELVDLCHTINAATAPLRGAAPLDPQKSSDQRKAA